MSTSRAQGSTSKSAGKQKAGSGSGKSLQPSSSKSSGSGNWRASSPAAAITLGLSNLMAAQHSSEGTMSATELRQARIGTRRAAISAAHNLNDLVMCVFPGCYREVVKDSLLSAMRARKQLDGVGHQLEGYVSDKLNGNVPALLRSSPPTVQLTKAFSEGSAGKAIGDRFAELHKEYQLKALDTLIEGKRAELSYLQGQTVLYRTETEEMQIDSGPSTSRGAAQAVSKVVPTDTWHALHAKLEDIFDSQFAKAKNPTFAPPTIDSHGRPVMREWETDTSVSDLFQGLLEDLPFIWARGLDFVEAQLRREEEVRDQKKSMQRDAFDNVDQEITTRSIRNMIQTEVARQARSNDDKRKGKEAPKQKKTGQGAGPKAKAGVTGGPSSGGQQGGRAPSGQGASTKSKGKAKKASTQKKKGKGGQSK